MGAALCLHPPTPPLDRSLICADTDASLTPPKGTVRCFEDLLAPEAARSAVRTKADVAAGTLPPPPAVDGVRPAAPLVPGPVWTRLTEEVGRVLGLDPSGPLPPEALDACPYLRAVVDETLRLCPIGSNARRVLRDADVAGVQFCAGDMVLIPMGCLHYDGELWGPRVVSGGGRGARPFAHLLKRRLCPAAARASSPPSAGCRTRRPTSRSPATSPGRTFRSGAASSAAQVREEERRAAQPPHARLTLPAVPCASPREPLRARANARRAGAPRADVQLPPPGTGRPPSEDLAEARGHGSGRHPSRGPPTPAGIVCVPRSGYVRMPPRAVVRRQQRQYQAHCARWRRSGTGTGAGRTAECSTSWHCACVLEHSAAVLVALALALGGSVPVASAAHWHKGERRHGGSHCRLS